MRQLALSFIALASITACAFEPGGAGEPADTAAPDAASATGTDAAVTPPPPPPPPPATVDCRVDGPRLGVVGLTVRTPHGQWVFASWQVDAGALVGFELTGPTPVRYEVRADDARFWGETLRWTHPDLAADDAEPISRVDFCAMPDGGDGPGR